MYEEKRQQINPKMIKQIREKLNINQQTMAERLMTDRARLSKIERGLETPEWLLKFALLSRLLHESGMTWEDVVMNFPEPTPRAAESPGKYNV